MECSKSRLLILASEFPPDVGGIGNHAWNLARNLSESGFAVSVMADQLGKNENDASSAGTDSFHFHPLYRNKMVYVTYFMRIFLSLKFARKNDVIICTGKFPLWLILILKNVFPKKKFIAVVHGSELMLPSVISRWLTGFSLKRFHAIIAVSDFTKRLLPKNVLVDSDVFVIPNGIDGKEFFCYQSITGKKLKSERAGALNLITVGSVTQRKGQENVIRALPAVLKHFPLLKYHIVGKPIMQSKLTAILSEFSLENHVVFYGMTDRKDLIRLLQMADIKIMLSESTKTEVEGFGIALLEANAVGTPTIGSLHSGIEDAIKDGINGKLVEAKNPKQVAAAICEIMNQYTAYSGKALEWAKEHDWKNVIKEYVRTIEKVEAL